LSTHYTADAQGPPRAGARRAPLLEGLGATIRLLRKERNLTLRALARSAAVSERFVVQLEAGMGNISVARLEDIAEALQTTGAEILSRATRLATRTSQGKAGRPASPVVALVGLRGAGKSSVGAAVASRLGIPFLELDEEIVREAQMTLATIFEIHGEAYYRTMEREVLRRLLASGKPLLLATGGSIVTDPETWALLRERTRTIWLQATPREHWDRVVSQGDVRPMRGRPRAMNELRQLLDARTPLYEQAELAVDTTGTPLAEVVKSLADQLKSG
jgi:XRE family aerobic/anaerobic benzoate catabolism transcriptional regulator